mgnify:FL=1
MEKVTKKNNFIFYHILQMQHLQTEQLKTQAKETMFFHHHHLFNLTLVFYFLVVKKKKYKRKKNS